MNDLSDCLERIRNSDEFEGQEKYWREFLSLFWHCIRDIQGFASARSEYTVYSDAIKSDLAEDGPIRYLYESRNHMIHPEERRYELPWMASKELISVGGFGFQLDPQRAVPSESGVQLRGCVSSDGPIPDLEVKSNWHRQELIASKPVRYERTKAVLLLLPAFRRNGMKIDAPQMKPVAGSVIYPLGRFGLGYLFAACEQIGLSGIKVSYSKDGSDELTVMTTQSVCV